MWFLGYEKGQPLGADRREVDLRFHFQVAGVFPDVVRDGGPVEAGGRPRGLEGHAEVAAADLFLHGFDVGAQLEKELGDPGDDAWFVPSDQGDRGELFGHADRNSNRRPGWRLI